MVQLHVDNRSGCNPVHHQSSKHIGIMYHFIRHEIKENNIMLFYVPSKENLAEIFTKTATKSHLKDFNIFLVYRLWYFSILL